MKKAIDTGISFFVWLLVLFFVLILFSLLFPNTIPFLDGIRLPVQSAIMKAVSHVAIRDFTLDDHYNIVTDQTESLTRLDIKSSIAQLQPGDIFFTDSRYASSFFIPWKRQHSIIYLGNSAKLAQMFWTGSDMYYSIEPYFTNDMEELIIDSTSAWVHIRNLMDVANLKDNDNSYLESLIAFRIVTDTNSLQKFLHHALDNIGTTYDFDLITEDPSSLYCSELIYESLKKIWIKLKVKSSILWRLYVSPNDIVDHVLWKGIEDNDFSLLFALEKKDGNVISIDTQKKE